MDLPRSAAPPRIEMTPDIRRVPQTNVCTGLVCNTDANCCPYWHCMEIIGDPTTTGVSYFNVGLHIVAVTSCLLYAGQICMPPSQDSSLDSTFTSVCTSAV